MCMSESNLCACTYPDDHQENPSDTRGKFRTCLDLFNVHPYKTGSYFQNKNTILQ